MDVQGRQRRQSKILQSSGLTDLRRRAEQDLAAAGRPSPTLAREDIEGLLYELQVHQIELEMQCRQLQESQCEVEESRNRYRELYESMPIGYATLDAGGKIWDLNPAGASLLGFSATTGHLPNFHVFISTRDVNRFDLLCREVLLKDQSRTTELLLERADGVDMSAEISIQPARASVGPSRLRLAFQDISAKKTAQAKVKQQQRELERHHQELQFLTEKLLTAHEEERNRIASKLQDDPCRRLDSCIGEVQSVAQRVEGGERQRIQHISARLQALVGDIRRLAQDLAPPEIENLPLPQSIRRYVEQLSVSSRLPIEFRDQNVPTDLPQPIARCLFRLMQESLGNVIKHAQAKHAVVALAGSDAGIEMHIVDDGQGFDLTQVLRERKGLGLANIRERVRWLGGKVVIESQPGKGAELSVFIPLSARGSATLNAA